MSTDSHRSGNHELILVLVMLLAVCTFVLVEFLNYQYEGTAQVINVAGRQRMLSQRVTLFASEYRRTGASSARDELISAVRLMRKQHELLAHPAPGSVFEERLTPRLRSLYETDGLRHDLHRFFGSAEQIASSPRTMSNQEAEDFRDLGLNQLLTKLDRTVSLYQSDAESTLVMLHRVKNGAFGVLLLSLLGLFFLVFRPLSRSSDQMHRLAMTDELTGLANRRSFFASCYLFTSCGRNAGADPPSEHGLALLLLDIDNFKSINDQYGHDEGDVVLRDVAKVLRQQARQQDPVGRLGGEEFGVLFTQLTPEQARAASQRFIDQVAAHESQLASGTNLRVTMSGGLTMVEPGEDIEVAYRRADQLLYQAKRSGKARIEYGVQQRPVGTLVDLRTGRERGREGSPEDLQPAV